MAKRQFKAESKRLLDLMINSIYTNKEIFLRELISNASDAMDKLYYKSLTDNISGLSRTDFSIEISVDEEARTLTISDNGIGMTKDELADNLGTIAKSGSGLFKADADDEKAAEDSPVPASSRRTRTTKRRLRTSTSSVSSASASTRPSWSPKKLKSCRKRSGKSRPGSGPPPARTATPSRKRSATDTARPSP